MQFADYALWEQNRLDGPALTELVDYWQATLDGLETVQMPTDRPRPVAADHDGGIERRNAGSRTLDRLRALARQQGSTPFVVLMATLQALMHRYTGQTDIVVGTASANRTRAELAPLIGFLVNTLPIRTDLSGDPSFIELLDRVRQQTLAAYSHQDLPFAKLVDVLRVERDTSRSPIFQVGLTYAEAAGPIPAAGLSLELELVDLMAAKFDLNFFVEARDGELSLEVSYPPALYDPETVQRTPRPLRADAKRGAGRPAVAGVPAAAADRSGAAAGDRRVERHRHRAAGDLHPPAVRVGGRADPGRDRGQAG